MKIQSAEMRHDDGFLRTFVTVEGREYLLPIAKPVILAQGMTDIPDDWPFRVETREIFTDLLSEDSPMIVNDGITEPRLVAIAISARMPPQIDRTIPVPTEAEAVDTIRAYGKQVAAEQQ